jgi:hypothetical protein
MSKRISRREALARAIQLLDAVDKDLILDSTTMDLSFEVSEAKRGLIATFARLNERLQPN